jgi:hypothetical protein
MIGRAFFLQYSHLLGKPYSFLKKCGHSVYLSGTHRRADLPTMGAVCLPSLALAFDVHD